MGQDTVAAGRPARSHREALARVLADVVGPRAGEVDARARFPREGLAALAGAGVLGCTVARELGGGGLWLREAADVVRRVAGVCASTATVLQSHFAAVAVLEERGPRTVRSDVAAGRHLATSAVHLLPADEAPGVARQRGGVADLRGRHPWVTAAGEADSYVWSSGESLWLVPASAPGLLVPEAGDASALLGLRGAGASSIGADPATVPADALLADVDGAALVADVAFPWFAVLGAAVGLGTMDSAIELTASVVRGTRSGTALTELARMSMRADSVRALFAETLDAVTWPRHGGSGTHASLLALRAAAVQTAIGVTDLAMKVCQCSAPSGRAEVAQVERRFRDARAGYAIPPAPDALLARLGALRFGG